MEKKVIQVDFIKKKRVEEESKKGEPVDIGNGLKNFVDGRNENDPIGLMLKITLSGVMIHDKIEEIKRNTEDFSQEVFSERKVRVRTFTNDQLFNAFAKSNSIEWHKDPAFYRAIIIEIRERLRMIVESTD